MATTTTQNSWNSRLGFILASAGSAVGLGSIWKFPYMVGAGGGAAFMLPYIFLSMTVGLSLLLSEFVIGRAGRSDPYSSISKVISPKWGIFGLVGICTSFTILCFYSAVGGWCLKYLWDALLGQGIVSDASLLQSNFDHYVSNGWAAVGSQFVFLFITAYIVLHGVNKGIERCSKILMPLLFILMLIMIVRGITLPGGWEGVEYLFYPRWEKLTSEVLFNAMGFTFFSLSIGAGTMMTYASYLPGKSDLVNSSAWVVFLTIMASILGGLMILPTVFAFHLDPTVGPQLTFVTMPAIFSQMPLGHLFAIIFYLCLIFAAITSSVSMFEPTVEMLHRKFGVQRIPAVLAMLTVVMIIGSFCALSFGSMADFKIFGKTVFDLLDFLTSNVGMPIAAMGAAFGAAWFSWKSTSKQLQSDQILAPWVLLTIRLLMGVLSPILIVAVVAFSLLN